MMKTLKGFLSKIRTSWNMILIVLVLEFVILVLLTLSFCVQHLLFPALTVNLPGGMISLFVTLLWLPAASISRLHL